VAVGISDYLPGSILLFFFDGVDRCVGTGTGDEMGLFYATGK
jgi:hypothetical protein